MSLTDYIIFPIFKFLLPPKSGSDPSAVYRWRMSIYLAVMLLIVSTGFQAAWSWGWIPGLSGFATISGEASREISTFVEIGNLKTAQKQIEQKIDNISISILEQTILDLRIKQCRATNSEARIYIQEKLSERLREYQRLTGQTYQLPDCEQVR